MEELFELRSLIESKRYPEALLLLGEMEEMSRDDKINKISSLLEIILLHLIKQHAEERTTRSWTISIRNAIQQILRTNKRRKAGGFYLTQDDLQDAVEESYENALRLASLEALEGRFDPTELGERVDPNAIMQEALHLIQQAQTNLNRKL